MNQLTNKHDSELQRRFDITTDHKKLSATKYCMKFEANIRNQLLAASLGGARACGFGGADWGACG